MSGRSVPYTYTCAECGQEDVAENARGPRRSRCRACLWGRTGVYRKRQTVADRSTPPAPAVRPTRCEGCASNLGPQPSMGRPRRFCLACRPSKPTDPESTGRVAAEAAAWREEHRLELKPHLVI